MKQFYLLTTAAILIFGGCSGNSRDKKAAEERISAEISTYDSISSQLENTKTEIDTLTRELDNIINEL